MDHFPPLHLLHPRAQQIIRIADSEMSLSYPLRRPGHAHAVRRNPTLRELVRLLIGVEAESLDPHSCQVLLTLLDFGAHEIPSNQQATKNLQHRDMMKQLYSRGLTRYRNPGIAHKNPLTRADKMQLTKINRKIVLDGNTDALILATTLPNLGFRLSAGFRFEPFTRTPVHSIELIFEEPEETSEGAIYDSPIASPSDIEPIIPSRLLICNAIGAGSTSFPEYISAYYLKKKPHVTIITKTRLSSSSSKHVQRSLAFDHSICLDASGFSGGMWLLWNDADADVNLLSKDPYEMRVYIQPFNLDPIDD